MTATSVTQPPARAVSYQLAIVCVVAVLLGCERTPTAETQTETRSFRMGFSAIPPSPNQTTAVASLEMWRTRADAAIMHVDVQWAAMLSGISATNAARATRSSSRIQRLYRDYVVAIADVVRPMYLGLAAETNLIRAAAPLPVYDAIVRMTTDAVADLRARGVTTPLYVSVQVETAWGRLAGTNGSEAPTARRRRSRSSRNGCHPEPRARGAGG